MESTNQSSNEYSVKNKDTWLNCWYHYHFESGTRCACVCVSQLQWKKIRRKQKREIRSFVRSFGLEHICDSTGFLGSKDKWFDRIFALVVLLLLLPLLLLLLLLLFTSIPISIHTHSPWHKQISVNLYYGLYRQMPLLTYHDFFFAPFFRLFARFLIFIRQFGFTVFFLSSFNQDFTLSYSLRFFI